jgi:DNA-binding PadR family transcriptional regulator
MQPVNFNGLDTVVHGPIRLGVLTSLQMDGSLDFTHLKKRLETPDGALGTHLMKLEEAGYITCKKTFVGRRPKSTYRITAAGRQALRDYLSTLRRVIDAVEQSTHGKSRT